MRLGRIALKLRAANTIFENRIAGAAELEIAMDNTLKEDSAYVIPLSEAATVNETDPSVEQRIIERFGVVVAIKNDSTDKDKLGIIAYDRLHEVRSQIFRAILGWEVPESETQIYYSGANLVNINRGYLWYQYEFEIAARVGFIDAELGQVDIITEDVDERIPLSELPSFDSIYADYIMYPSADLPYVGDLPVEMELADMRQYIDFTQNPDDGGFNRGFAQGFDVYKFLRR